MKIISQSQLREDFYKRFEENELPEVRTIISEVRKRGDEALFALTKKYDGAALTGLEYDLSGLRISDITISEPLKDAIQVSIKNLQRFSEKQLQAFTDFELEMEAGVFTGQKIFPLERVGVYVPGGRFPLFSSLLMGVVPAKAAGVKEVIVCTPPAPDGSIHPAIVYAAKVSGTNRLFTIGGAQAIAAMAYGSQSVPAVDKIVGPGNQYVTRAKKEVFGRVGIDFIAGPSEVLIIADDQADAAMAAADLLAQAEHDTDARAVLLTDSPVLAAQVKKEAAARLEQLPTRPIAEKSMQNNGLIVVVDNLAAAAEISNRLAPEHLELQVRQPEQFINKLNNYGSLFIGKQAAEVLGDYSSGLNHTLPTAGAARYTGGLSVKDFIKIQTTLRVEEGSSGKIQTAAYTMARAEGLAAHAEAVRIRT